MIIKEICASLPSRVVTNDDIVELILQNSKSYDGNLGQDVKFIKKLIQASGSNTRNWRADGETAIEHVKKCVDQVLDKSSIKPQDVELIIYAGVCQPFVEPASAAFFAQSTGCINAQCFDITEACMSWLRSLQLIDSLFASKQYKNAIVINAEFNNSIVNNALRLHSKKQLSYTIPNFTVGEAAAATLLLPDNPNNFKFNFTAQNDLASLSVAPVYADYDSFCTSKENVAPNGMNMLTSHGYELHELGAPYLTKIFNQYFEDSSVTDISMYFIHASSYKEWNRYAKSVGVEARVCHIYPDTGNIASASAPTAIYFALQKNNIALGDKLCIWIASAGMCFAVSDFIL